MDPKMQQIFEPLKASLMAQALTDIDLLEVIGGFAGTAPHVAQSLAYHARDILQEANAQTRQMEYAEIIAETYKRAFFDVDAAAKYGTADIPARGPDYLKEFSDFLQGGMAMESHEVDPVDYHETSDKAH